ncbi:MAG: diacylglycerol kinase family lipid kinase [Clostridium sp.]|nr:diacylglycerol kinase family lipid kinase [Clostridium sp.]
MYHVIINPAAKSGRGKKLWAQLEKGFQEQGVAYEAHFTRRETDAKRYAEELTQSGAPVKLLVCGGDGTLNEVLQGIHDLDAVELAYIPQGSANDFARDFSEKGNPDERLKRILEREPYQIDVGLVRITAQDGTESIRRFAGSSGIGYDAAVCEEVDRSALKRCLNRLHLGKIAYLVIGIKQVLQLDQHPVQIVVDKEQKLELERCLFSAFMVHRYEGGGFMFCPDADAFDGKLDVCVAENLTRKKFLCMLPGAFSGKHVRHKQQIHILRGKEILVRAKEPMYFHVDGEVICQAKELHLSCLHQKLRLYL